MVGGPVGWVEETRNRGSGGCGSGRRFLPRSLVNEGSFGDVAGHTRKDICAFMVSWSVSNKTDVGVNPPNPTFTKSLV